MANPFKILLYSVQSQKYITFCLPLWVKITACLKNKVYAVISLSQTRWSSNADAIKALKQNYLEVLETLSTIVECTLTKPVCQPLSLIGSLGLKI